MSEEVVTVFKLLGRSKHQTYDKEQDEQKRDLLIQPMMEAPDVRPQSLSEEISEALAQRESRLEAKEH